jgi:two-component system NtrC family sensor kinase
MRKRRTMVGRSGSAGRGRLSKKPRKSSTYSQRKIESLTRELSESSQQQAATAAVLKVISRSTFELQLVLETLIENATRLGDAEQGFIYRFDGELLRMSADYGASSEFRSFRQQNPPRPGDGSIVGRTALDRRTVHIPDILADPKYKLTHVQQLGGYRALLSVPMLREDTLVGVIHMWRTEARPFTENQIESVTSFADQAVIAIESARLYNDLQQRTRELSEALEQQTATFEVLRVIINSPGEPEAVFETILANATRICEAKFGTLYQRVGDAFRVLGIHGAPKGYVEQRRHEPLFRPLRAAAWTAW